MKRGVSVLLFSVLLGLIASAGFAQSQSWGQGQISFYAQTAATSQVGGPSFNSSELVSMFTLQSPYTRDTGMEFNVDVRYAQYPSSQGSSRFSIYNAYVGQHFGSGFLVRGGQMWLTELGSLGSVGGGFLQYKRKGALGGSIRFGGFFGFEPQILQAGYTPGVRKFGGFVAFEGDNGRSNVFGYVLMRNSGLTERSVLVANNFIPVGNQFVLYQALEYDLTPPAGQTTGNGLTYFFLNGRYTPNKTLEFQGTYHHGLSIDTRTITNDELNGRPVDPSLLQGYLFESVEGRVTVNLTRTMRVFVGFGRDKNNQNDLPLNRLNAGFYTPDLFGTGWDLRASFSRWTGSMPFNSYSFSAGHNLGRKVYLSADYTSSLSVFTFTGFNGAIITSRPNYKLFGVSSVMNLSRAISLMFTYNRTLGGTYSENRILGGITYRFQ